MPAYTYTYQIGTTHHQWTVGNPIPHADLQGRLSFSPQLQATQQMLLEMLEFWIQVARKHRIVWYAVAGTLLGAVRNEGIIPYDDDIDLGVPIDAYPTLARLSRMDLHPTFGIFQTDGCGARIYQRNGANTPAIDIWMMGLDDTDRRYVYAGPITTKQAPTYLLAQCFPYDWYDASDVEAHALRQVPFEHLVVPIPRHAKRILRRLYGADCLSRYVAAPQVHVSHLLMNVLNMQTIQNICEVLTIDLLRCDYRTLVCITQLLSSTTHSNADPERLARIITSMKHVTMPKRAFQSIM